MIMALVGHGKSRGHPVEDRIETDADADQYCSHRERIEEGRQHS